MRFILLFLLFCNLIHSQTKTVLNDFSFTLHEDLVNKVLLAIGTVSSTNEYEVMFIKGKYHWKMANPKILIRPDSSFFTCDAFVDVGPINYSTTVNGDVKILYDKPKDKISIKITRAIFELYTVILDKKVHIKDIHLEEKFKDPFLFDGPKSYGTSVDVTLPDSAKKTIYIQPSECELNIKWREVCAICEVTVSDKPPKPLQPATPLKSSSTYKATPESKVSATVQPKPKVTETKTVTPQKK
jgi:hypothetical protein